METKEQTQTQQKNEVVANVWGQKDKFVNYYFVRNDTDDTWFIIDTGLAGSAEKIRSMANKLFGAKPPAAIILTHGHFDHTGSVQSLAEGWHVPVYAHYLEFPYLSGKSSYPPPDPKVGGGLMSALSGFYRKEPIDISHLLTALPDDGTIPGLTGWRYIHTPGHSPGHISLFRESDRLLIAGDAFVTTKAESLMATITQKQEISGPPMYFTCDWDAAADSVRRLADLDPLVVASGHG
ncbi:MAG: MBL fold metallo-hydrolase, partial [Sphingobacteriales bacterium]